MPNIFDFVLGGEQHPQLLDIRFFEESTKKAAYKRQTEQAIATNSSNCPLCAISNNNNNGNINIITTHMISSRNKILTISGLSSI